MRVALAQLGAGADRRDNIARALTLIERAASEHGADLVVLPEFFNTTYFPQYDDVERYWDLAERADGPTLRAVRDAAARQSVHVIAPIYEDTPPGVRYDTAFVVGPGGEVVGRYRKTHAPLIKESHEKLYYTPGSRFPVFDIAGWRCGITLCYDWRFPEAARAVAVQGAEAILMPFAGRRTPMWEEALATRAWENQCYVAVCNKAGEDGTWLFAGQSLVADPSGRIVAHAGSAPDELIVADLDRAALRGARVKDFNWRDRRPEIYGDIAAPMDTIF